MLSSQPQRPRGLSLLTRSDCPCYRMAAMDTLFSDIERSRRKANAPLAARVRPRTLDGYVGQAQAVGEGSWLRRAIEHDTLFSLILYGPAGTGKTTLAHITYPFEKTLARCR